MNIAEQIKNLNNHEKSIILNFCKNKNVNFSKNSNGYFFNLKSNDTLVNELENLVNNIYNNRNFVSDYLYKRKMEQENLQKQIEQEMDKKKEDEYKNLLVRLTITDENIKLCIKNNNQMSNFTEHEWNQYMSQIDAFLKNKTMYDKNSTLNRLNKIIKSKRRKEQTGEQADENFSDVESNDEDEVVEDEIYNEQTEKTEIEEINVTEDQEHNHLETEDLTDSENVESDKEESDEVAEKTKDFEYNDLIKRVKDKLVLQGHSFNRNLDCRLVKEEYLK